MSHSLVSPNEITEAVDSDDLLDQLVAINTQKIQKKLDARIVSQWVSEEKAKHRTRYSTKARQAYEKMWSICKSSSLGHNFTNVDVRGYTILQCEDCKFAYPSSSMPTSGEYDYAARKGRRERELSVANEMNGALIKALSDRMIDVDIEAGIFAWPTANDYPNIVLSNPGSTKQKKFGIFR